LPEDLAQKLIGSDKKSVLCTLWKVKIRH